MEGGRLLLICNVVLSTVERIYTGIYIEVTYIANLCLWSLCVFWVRSHLVHRATGLLQVSTVTFCAALIGGGAVVAEAEMTAQYPASVHWRASPGGMPMWGPNRVCRDLAWFSGV